MSKLTPTARSRASAQRHRPQPDDEAGSTGAPIPDLPLNDETAGEGPQPIEDERYPQKR